MRYRLRTFDGVEIAIEGDRFVEPSGHFDLTLELGPGELRPGLINAHDHLHRNHYPRLGRPPYADADTWGRDIHENDAETIERARRVDRRAALLFGALKNLISGVTTVVHHDPWEPAFDEGFPIRVPRVRTVHSLGNERDRAVALSGTMDTPLCIHLAEGTTAAVAAEVFEADRLGLLSELLLAVHVVGADAEGIELLLRRRSVVVWCPTSNEWLLGSTAHPDLLRSARVVIGSDSLLTGEGTLLDELRAARSLGVLSDESLLDGVGRTAAEALAIQEPVLAPRAPADFVVLTRPVLEASVADVELVVVAGMPRVANPCYATLFDHAGVPCESLQIHSTTKLVSSPLASIASRIVEEWPGCGRIFASDTGRSAGAGVVGSLEMHEHVVPE